MQNDFGETALVAAVNEGHLHIAEILVKNGADVNYRNKVRALIPGTLVCIMWPHGIIMNLSIADMRMSWFLPLMLIKFNTLSVS